MKLDWDRIKGTFTAKRAALGDDAPQGIEGRITQAKLAALVGCNERTMRRYVSGDFGQMDADFFDAVTNALREYDYSMDDIWDADPARKVVRARNERG